MGRARFLCHHAAQEMTKVQPSFTWILHPSVQSHGSGQGLSGGGRCEGKCRPPSAARCPLGSCTFPPPCARLPPSSVLRARVPATLVSPPATVPWVENDRLAGTWTGVPGPASPLQWRPASPPVVSCTPHPPVTFVPVQAQCWFHQVFTIRTTCMIMESID